MLAEPSDSYGKAPRRVKVKSFFNDMPACECVDRTGLVFPVFWDTSPGLLTVVPQVGEEWICVWLPPRWNFYCRAPYQNSMSAMHGEPGEVFFQDKLSSVRTFDLFERVEALEAKVKALESKG